MSARYRTALISDIHGNAIALHAVLRSIEAQGVDEIVCLGDVATLGVAPVEVVATLQRLGCRCIMGNHDDYVIDPNLTDPHNDGALIVDSIDWCRDQLSSDQLAFIRGFASGFDMEPVGRHRLKLFHGSPSSNLVDLLADTPADVFDDQLGSTRTSVMAGGHTHLQMLRQHRGTLVVNPGSVGAPFEEYAHGRAPTILDHAEYAVVEFRDDDVGVAMHRVALDRAKLAKAARDSSFPMGPFLAQIYA